MCIEIIYALPFLVEVSFCSVSYIGGINMTVWACQYKE